jgi:hypothetical protein
MANGNSSRSVSVENFVLSYFSIRLYSPNNDVFTLRLGVLNYFRNLMLSLVRNKVLTFIS